MCVDLWLGTDDQCRFDAVDRGDLARPIQQLPRTRSVVDRQPAIVLIEKVNENMPANGCPDRSLLIAMHLGELPEASSLQWAGHLDNCTGCQETMSRLREREPAELYKEIAASTVRFGIDGNLGAPATLAEPTWQPRPRRRPPIGSEEFLGNLRAVNLASPAQLEPLLAKLAANKSLPSVQVLAQELVNARLLTCFRRTRSIGGAQKPDPRRLCHLG